MTTINRFLRAICLIAFLVTTRVLTAQAGPSSSVSLASLTNGETLVVGDKAFTDFSISGDFLAGQVTVTPITVGGNFGIEFGGNFSTSNSALDMVLGYQVSVTNSANLISAANLSFNGMVTGGTGLAEVIEQVFTNGSIYGQMSVFATATSSNLTTSLAINPPQPMLEINKDVLLTATVPAFSSITTIDQTFTQVPEPSALFLVAAGFSGLALLRRRR